MLPKFDELVALCSNDKPDIICLVETWICEDVFDSEIHIPNCSILRLYGNRHGGGVALYIRNSILYNVLLCVSVRVWLCETSALTSFTELLSMASNLAQLT